MVANMVGGSRMPAMAVIVFSAVSTLAVALGSLEASASTFAIGAQVGEVEEPALEESLGSFTQEVLTGTKRLVRRSYWMLSRTVIVWGRWIRRAALFIPIALVIALADRALVAAWRREGLSVLANYVPLMLYVYARLLFSRAVRWWWKLMVFAAIAYGVRRRDLFPDRNVVPGLVDDIAVIAVATRAFLSACPEALVSAYAERALSWRRRFLTLQRARQR